MKIGVLGARGRMGSCIAAMLSGDGHEVVGVDAGDPWEPALVCDAVMNCLPAAQAVSALNAAKGKHYVDLCESLTTARRASKLAPSGGTYMPNSGLAPGAVSIVAAHMIAQAGADELVIYCGALPADRKVGYRITWSLDGLLGIYQDWCFGLEDGGLVCRPALQECEEIGIGGELFEAFSTAGGSGTLPQTYTGRLKVLRYKTLRYPGHFAQAKKLLQESDPREAFLAAFAGEPVEDRVVVRIEARQRGSLGMLYERDIRPQNGWSAIQMATAAGAVGALFATRGMSGYVRQEQIPYSLWTAFQPAGVFVD